MHSLSFYFKHPRFVLNYIFELYGGKHLSDETFLRVKYWLALGKKLNLDNPQTFSEKLQWLKLNDRRPEYTDMVDKVKAKEHVASILGDEFIIPTLGVWEDPEKIDFDALPDRFVIKCNHNSGTGMYICKDKSKMDIERVKKELRKGLKNDYYLIGREWPYKNVARRILAEKFIDPAPDMTDLPDYKFFCFNGEPKFCQVISNRNTNMSIDFFDFEWKHQPFHEPHNYPFADTEPQKPKNYEKMWDAAARLAKGKPFSRIDFYDVGERVYFGEITFYPTSGMGGFDPDEWDVKFGEWIKLPSI